MPSLFRKTGLSLPLVVRFFYTLEFSLSILRFTGDDEVVTLWSLASGRKMRTFLHQCWGQVTTLSLIPTRRTPQVLIVGTGRGIVCVVGLLQEFMASNRVFLDYNAVSDIAIDPSNNRIAVGSMNGEVKVATFDPNFRRHPMSACGTTTSPDLQALLS